MKKKILTLACALLILTTTATLAQNPPVLGTSHYSAELDVMFLQHRDFTTDDGGVYLGLAGYGHLGGNWYLGGEIGIGAGFGLLLVESSTFMPIELNAKRAYALSSSFVVDIGAGLSYNRVQYTYNPWFSNNDNDVTNWVFGGQLFGDLTFKTGRFLIGLKIKYQLTADLPDVESVISPEEGWDNSNLRIGLAIGFMVPD